MRCEQIGDVEMHRPRMLGDLPICSAIGKYREFKIIILILGIIMTRRHFVVAGFPALTHVGPAHTACPTNAPLFQRSYFVHLFPLWLGSIPVASCPGPQDRSRRLIARLSSDFAHDHEAYSQSHLLCSVPCLRGPLLRTPMVCFDDINPKSAFFLCSSLA
jgi:hypothetical protein